MVMPQRNFVCVVGVGKCAAEQIKIPWPWLYLVQSCQQVRVRSSAPATPALVSLSLSLFLSPFLFPFLSPPLRLLLLLLLLLLLPLPLLLLVDA